MSPSTSVDRVWAGIAWDIATPSENATATKEYFL